MDQEKLSSRYTIREGVLEMLSQGNVSVNSKIKFVRDIVDMVFSQKDEDFRKESFNGIADAVVVFAFPYPNCREKLIQCLLSLVSMKEIFFL